MENFNNIYKASELIKLVPELAPHIETEDWIHVAISHDPITHNTCLISFVWDTRDIVRCGLYADEESGVELLHSNHENFFKPAIANDNHTWLKIRHEEDMNFLDYIRDVNHEIMNVPVKLKLKCETETLHDGFNKAYSIDGLVICYTTKSMQCFNSVDKKTGRPSLIRDDYKYGCTTTYNRTNLNIIFGMEVNKYFTANLQNSSYHLKYGDQGHADTPKEIKQYLMEYFNVIF